MHYRKWTDVAYVEEASGLQQLPLLVLLDSLCTLLCWLDLMLYASKTRNIKLHVK